MLLYPLSSYLRCFCAWPGAPWLTHTDDQIKGYQASVFLPVFKYFNLSMISILFIVVHTSVGNVVFYLVSNTFTHPTFGLLNSKWFPTSVYHLGSSVRIDFPADTPTLPRWPSIFKTIQGCVNITRHVDMLLCSRIYNI